MRVLYFVFAFLSISSTAFTQDQEGVKKEGAHQSEYNSDAQQTENAAEYDSRDMDKKEKVGDERSEETQSTSSLSGGGSTASPSGSPGMLNENQETPDGTNTMQRATLNTAGSPVPGSTSVGRQGNQKNDDRSDAKTISGKEQKTVPALKDKSDDDGSDRKEKSKKKDRKNKK